MLDKSESNPVSRADIINLCYGADSKIWRAFHDKLDWTHNKCLQFMMKRCKLSEFSLITEHGYSASLMEGMMDKTILISCFEEMHKVSSVLSQLIAARE